MGFAVPALPRPRSRADSDQARSPHSPGSLPHAHLRTVTSRSVLTRARTPACPVPLDALHGPRLMLDTPLMLWELIVTEQRYRAVLEVMAGVPVTEVAERYRVSRHERACLAGPLPRAKGRRPGGPQPQGPCPSVADSGGTGGGGLRAAPGAPQKWGPKRLVFQMGRRGLGTVTRSTVYRVLVRDRLIQPRSRRRRRQDYTRWERPVPMQLWQLDVTASAFLAERPRGEDRDRAR